MQVDLNVITTVAEQLPEPPLPDITTNIFNQTPRKLSENPNVPKNIHQV